MNAEPARRSRAPRRGRLTGQRAGGDLARAPAPRQLRFSRSALVLGPGALGAVVALLSGGCDLAYPEVVVVNSTAETVQLRRLSFNGCAWNEVLAFGEATSVGRCLPGEGRVHFERLDAAAYCARQAEYGTIAGVCPCDGPVDEDRDEDLNSAVPTWFNYQTTSVEQVGYGDFRVFEIELADIEQDFSVPGPYGH